MPRMRLLACLLLCAPIMLGYAQDKPNRIERAAKKTANSAERTVKKVGKAVERTADKTENWIRKKTE
jgi:hypothetical protein